MLLLIQTLIKRTFRLRYIIKCIKALLFDKVRSIQKTNPKTFLIVRLDAIGDYILFRNFLEVIRNSAKYKDYTITLCGNELWKDIAETFDNNFVDDFLWIDTSSFLNNNSYRQQALNDIVHRGFEIAVCPNASRNFLLGDSIIRASNAKVRIGTTATKSIDNFVFGKIGNLFYTKLINITAPPFEFDKNILFFESLLNTTVDFKLPYFNISKEKRENYIVILPGAGERKRQWNINNFATLSEYLLKKHPYNIIVAGSSSDQSLADYIKANVTEPARVENICGKTSLSNLIKIISTAKLVIAHDSGGLHMAVANKTSVIGLMTGKHYKRFGPYPNQPEHVTLIFPNPIEYYEELYQKYGHAYFEDVISDINTITVSKVISTCDKIL